MMRPEYVPAREMLRALTTAVGALRRAGIQKVSDHIALVGATNRLFTAMLVKRSPFTHEEVERLRSWSSRSPYFRVTAAPGLSLPDNEYQFFLNLRDPHLEWLFTQRYPFDVRPVEDDRPFFFRYSHWSQLFAKDPIIRASPVMEWVILLLLGVTVISAFACIYLPLRYLHREEGTTAGAGRYGVFFAGIGLGYLAIEVALLQKFGLFLGHPNYALSVVLAALLFASGIGSFFSASIVKALGTFRFVSYVLALLVLAEYVFVFPRLPGLVGLPLTTRAALVFALILPVGTCMGTFLPTALDRMKLTTPAFAPWAWGLNGIFSVIAPVASVAVSMSWGVNLLLISAIPVYLASALVLPSSTAHLSGAPR